MTPAHNDSRPHEETHNPSNKFVYERSTFVYETDMMGIVHHSNYLRYCEEARIAWCKKYFPPSDQIFSLTAVNSLTVVETRVQHKAPIKYGDQLQISTQVRLDKSRIIFQYKILSHEKVFARVETVHCSVNEKLQPIRPTSDIIQAVQQGGQWIETWL